MRSQIAAHSVLHEVLADVLAGPLNAVERIAGAVDDFADVGAIQDLAGSRVDGLPVRRRARGPVDARRLSGVELLGQEGGSLLVGVELRLDPLEAESVVQRQTAIQ